jgi:large subunit ribosomal protein L22
VTFGIKTNEAARPGTHQPGERPGTRAEVRYSRLSAYKAREVLDLIRGKEVQQADEILQFVERDAAIVVRKCLRSAMANAEHNDQIDPEELYVSACYADEGPTLKRWRPRARGRASRIRKRTCHITIVVSRLSEEQLEKRRQREAASPAAAGRRRRRSQAAADVRRRRVARSRQREQVEAEHDHDHEHDHDDEGLIEPADTESSAATEDESAREPAEGADVTDELGEAEADIDEGDGLIEPADTESSAATEDESAREPAEGGDVADERKESE